MVSPKVAKPTSRRRAAPRSSTPANQADPRSADAELRLQAARCDALIRAIPDIVMEVDVNKVYTWANDAGRQFFGDDVVGREAADYFVGDQDTYGAVHALFEGDEDTFAVRSWQRRVDGTPRLLAWWCRVLKDARGRVTGAISTARDVTERTSAEREREITVDLLRLVNESQDTRGLVQGAARFFQDLSRCEAVGIRLRDGDDFPYYETRGFPPAFVMLERRLCAYDADGTILRDSVGNPVLECMCGNVIRGRFDPTLPFFTAGGSFWTNSTTTLLASTSDADRQARTRNRCNGEGYESVALIPLSVGEQRFGLLQLNDRQPGRFSAEGIAFWERLVGYLALGLSKFRADEALRGSAAQLRDSHELFESVLGHTHMMVVCLDAQFRFLWVNRAYAETCRRDPGFFPGKNHFDLYPDAENLAVFRRVVETGEPHVVQAKPFEFPDQPERGVTYWDWSLVPLRDALGAVDRLVFTLAEVTERVKAERALAAARESLDLALDGADLGTYDGDLVHGRLTLDHRYLRTLGYEPGEAALTYDDWQALIHPDDLPAVLREAASVRGRVKEGFDAEYRMRHRSGAWFWVLDRGRGADWDEQGRPRRAVGTHLDITKRKTAELALQASEHTLRSLFEAINESVLLIARDGRILAANPTCAERLGKRVDECLGVSVYDLVSPETAARRRVGIEEAVRTGEPATYEDERGDRCLLHSVRPIRGLDGQADRVVVFAVDVTERRRIERELLQSQKMESVGRLAGGVAHDFNNMLGVILGHVEMALGRVDAGDPLHEDLTEVRDAATRSADLTRQLLAFARRQTITPRVVDLDEAIDGMLKMLRRLIGEDISLVWMPGGRLWPVSVDPAQVNQALANLCVNARDAIRGVGSIRIETANETLDAASAAVLSGLPPGDYVRLTIADTGAGMPPEVLAHVFEPFFTTKGVGVGTGLGLATVYGIVKQNHGAIAVESEPGSGTTFRLYLPRHTGSGPFPQSASPVSDRAVPRGQETILLVEDEPAILNVSRRILEGLGYTVLAARRPSEAMAIAASHPTAIHLLLTDIVMPEMNGCDLAGRLAALRPTLRCLLMSGYPDDEATHGVVLDGGTPFIEKPFTRAQLSAKVREVLDRV